MCGVPRLRELPGRMGVGGGGFLGAGWMPAKETALMKLARDTWCVVCVCVCVCVCVHQGAGRGRGRERARGIGR